MNRRPLTIISLVATIINGFAFALSNFNEIYGLIFLIWAVITLMLNNEAWAFDFRKNLGLGIFAGLIVSGLRDLATKEFFELIELYFFGLAAAVILLLPSASQGEEI